MITHYRPALNLSKLFIIRSTSYNHINLPRKTTYLYQVDCTGS